MNNSTDTNQSHRHLIGRDRDNAVRVILNHFESDNLGKWSTVDLHAGGSDLRIEAVRFEKKTGEDGTPPFVAIRLGNSASVMLDVEQADALADALANARVAR